MLGHVTLDCATEGCFAIIAMHRDDELRLRRTHKSFYCPAGHSNYFAGKTAQEKKIDELESRVELLRARLSEDHELRWEIHQALLDVARGALVCPMGCGWKASRRLPTREGPGSWCPSEEEICRFFDRVWNDLRDHLAENHNAAVKTMRPASAQAS